MYVNLSTSYNICDEENEYMTALHYLVRNKRYAANLVNHLEEYYCVELIKQKQLDEPIEDDEIIPQTRSWLHERPENDEEI